MEEKNNMEEKKLNDRQRSRMAYRLRKGKENASFSLASDGTIYHTDAKGTLRRVNKEKLGKAEKKRLKREKVKAMKEQQSV